MSYPTASEVRTLLRATQPGTVLWEGRLEQTAIDEPSALFGMVPPMRQVVVDRRGALAVLARFIDEGRCAWYAQGRRGNESVVQFALSRHGLCAPPVGWEEVVL